MAKKERSLSELKQDLSSLQDEIHHLEGKKQKAVKTLFRWQAFSRPYTRRSPKWFVYTFLLVATILLVLLFVREFFIIAPVLSLAFLAYVLASRAPEIIENAITTQGVNNHNHSYIWEEMDEFWFTQKNGFTLLHIETYLQLPVQLILLINKDDREKIKEILARYIPYRELPKTTWLDTLSEYLTRGVHKLTS